MSDVPPVPPEPIPAAPAPEPAPPAPAAATPPQAPAAATPPPAASPYPAAPPYPGSTPPPTSPYAPPASPYAAPPLAPAGGRTPILSIIAIVCSGLAFLGGSIVAIPFIGSILDLFLPVAGIVLGLLARTREPHAPKILWILAVAVGAFCILWAIIFLIVWSVAAASGALNSY